MTQDDDPSHKIFSRANYENFIYYILYYVPFLYLSSTILLIIIIIIIIFRSYPLANYPVILYYTIESILSFCLIANLIFQKRRIQK